MREYLLVSVVSSLIRSEVHSGTLMVRGGSFVSHSEAIDSGNSNMTPAKDTESACFDRILSIPFS
jgi:hypothetical protein